MNKRASFLGLSIFCVLITILLILVSFITNGSLYNVNSLTTLSLGILSFSVWYLYSDFFQKDERSEFLRKKAVNTSYFILVILIVVFYLLSAFEVLSLNMLETFQIITGLATIGLSISWIVITKKN